SVNALRAAVAGRETVYSLSDLADGLRRLAERTEFAARGILIREAEDKIRQAEKLGRNRGVVLTVWGDILVAKAEGAVNASEILQEAVSNLRQALDLRPNAWTAERLARAAISLARSKRDSTVLELVAPRVKASVESEPDHYWGQLAYG